MKAKIYGTNGKQDKEVTLPKAFEEVYRPDLIKRAFLSIKSSKYQAKGTDSRAGLKNSARYSGRRGSYLATINRSMARLPRLRHYPRKGRIGEVRKVPQARGGRRAHPPKTEKKLKEKINKKEKKKAFKSALAATANIEIVKRRGHNIEKLEMPIIASNDLEEIKKTKDVVNFLEKIGLSEDIKKSKKRKVKQGRGKTRGRKYRRRKTVLIASGEDKGIVRAARNIPGADVVLAKNLNVSELAPGGQAGRVTVYTENALNEIKKRTGE